MIVRHRNIAQGGRVARGTRKTASLIAATGLIWIVANTQIHGQEMLAVDNVTVDPATSVHPHTSVPPLALNDPFDPIKRIEARDRAPFRFSASWVPRQDITGSDDTLATSTISSQLAVPLRIFPDGIWAATFGLRHIGLTTDAVLPQTSTPVPNDLWDVRTGMLFTRKLASGWNVGGIFNFGSASDRPFDSADELTMTSIGFVSIPTRPRESWNFSLFYSPTGQVAFPIPGISYTWRPTDALEAQIGLPASIVYAPNDRFSFVAKYTPLTDIRVETRQAIGRNWAAFARYQVFNETYWLADRDNRLDRLFLFEQQLAAGLTRNLPAGFAIDASAAYVFDRQIFQSEDFDLSGDNAIEIDPGVAYQLQLVWIR